MKWSEAVKIWNHQKHSADTNHAWIIPHAGTEQHAEVKKIQEMEKTSEHEEILSKPSKSTLARQRVAAQRKKERAERKAMIKAEKEQRKAEKKAMKKPRMKKAKHEDEMEKARQEMVQEEQAMEERAKEVVSESRSNAAPTPEEMEAVEPKKKDKPTYGLKGPMIAKQRKHLQSLLAEGAKMLSDTSSLLFDAAKWKSANKGVKERVLDILSVIGNMPEITKDKVVLEMFEKEKAFDKPKRGQPKVLQVIKSALKRRNVDTEKAKEYLRSYSPMNEEVVEVKEEEKKEESAPVEIPKKEFVKEHKKLIKVMKPVAAELKEQTKELKTVVSKPKKEKEKEEKIEYPPPITPEESKTESKDRKKIRQFYSYYDKTFFKNAQADEKEEYFGRLYDMMRFEKKNKDLVFIPDFAKKGYNQWLRKEAKRVDKMDMEAEKKKQKAKDQESKNE